MRKKKKLMKEINMSIYKITKIIKKLKLKGNYIISSNSHTTKT
jgi:biotin operon repressor